MSSRSIIIITGVPSARYFRIWDTCAKQEKQYDVYDMKKFKNNIGKTSGASGKMIPTLTPEQWQTVFDDLKAFKDGTAVDYPDTTLLLCRGHQWLSAPGSIWSLADQIVCAYCNQMDTLEMNVAIRRDIKEFFESTWPEAARGFEMFFKDHYERVKEKVWFVKMDSAQIEEGTNLIDFLQEKRFHDWEIGNPEDAKRDGTTTRTLDQQQEAGYAQRLREDMKKKFRQNWNGKIREVAANADLTPLDRLKFVRRMISLKDKHYIWVDKEDRQSFLGMIMEPKGHYGSFARSLVLEAVKVFASVPTTKTQVAMDLAAASALIESKFKHMDGRNMTDYRAFVQGEEMNLLLDYVETVHIILTSFYPSHNEFCLENAEIFELSRSLLQCNDIILIYKGFQMVSGVLCLDGAERFSKHYCDLKIPIVAAIFEAKSYLIAPLASTADRDLRRKYYCLLAQFLSSHDYTWESQMQLLKGFAPHAAAVTPAMVVQTLGPLMKARDEFYDSLSGEQQDAVDLFTCQTIATFYSVLKQGNAESVVAVLNYGYFILDIVDARNRIALESTVFRSTEIANNMALMVLQLVSSYKDQISLVHQEGEETDDNAAKSPKRKSDGDRSEMMEPFTASESQYLVKWLKETQASEQAIRAERDKYSLLNAQLGQSVSELEKRFNKLQVEAKTMLEEKDSKIQVLEKDIESLQLQINASVSRQLSRTSSADLNSAGSKALGSSNSGSRIIPVSDILMGLDPAAVLTANPAAAAAMIPSMETLGMSSIEVSKELDQAGINDPQQVPDEKLVDFVQLLSSEWQSLHPAVRPCVCGVLYQLGEPLYSSEAHFAQELLQNADDNTFDLGVDPTVHVFLTGSSIAFGNNEKGMSASDVRSICSMAASLKSAGLQTGQKGLGFKSVFACSHNPHVISNRWSFCFDYVPGSELAELAFVNPIWVDPSHYPKDVKLIRDHPDGWKDEINTLVHLPMEGSRISNVLKGLCSSLNPVALLCTRKIQNIHVHSISPSGSRFAETKSVKRPSVDARVVSAPSMHNALPRQWTLVDKEISCWNAELSLESITNEAPKFNLDDFFSTLPWNADGKFRYIAYEAHIRYPKENVKMCSVRRAKPDVPPTAIRIVFPHPEHRGKPCSWPVSSTLPICDVGLPFLLQADWDLVTSRESLRMSEWNQHLIDCFVQLLKFAFETDEIIKNNLSAYLVKVMVEGDTRLFWKHFETEVTNILRGQLPPNLMLADPQIDQYLGIEEETFKTLLNIEISTREQDAELLRSCDRVVSIFDVLKCFQHESFWQRVSREKDRDWWARLFELMISKHSAYTGSAEKRALLELATQQPLFLINTKTPRSTRSRIDFNSAAAVFVCVNEEQKRSFYTWRDDLITAWCDSRAEREFFQLLAQATSFGVMMPPTVADVVDKLALIHTRNVGNDVGKVWGDFVFLGKSLLKKEPEIELMAVVSNSFRVPTSTGGYYPLKETTLISAIGIQMADPSELEPPVVCVKVPNTLPSLADICRVEMLLMACGCQLPTVGTQPATAINLPFSFEDLTSEDALTGEALLKQLQKRRDVMEYLNSSLVPVVTTTSNPDAAASAITQNIPVHLACADYISAANGVLPCIVVPEHTSNFARMLGVATQVSIGCAFRAMRSMVKRRCEDVSQYATWLAYVQSSHRIIDQANVLAARPNSCLADVAEEARDRGDDLLVSACEWLHRIRCKPVLAMEVRKPVFAEAEGAKKKNIQYLPVTEIYCGGDRVMDIAAPLLGRAVVNQSQNGVLSPFSDTLKQLGCKSEVSLREAVLAIISLYANPLSRVREGKGHILTMAALEQLLVLYEYVESKLVQGETADARKAILAGALPTVAQTKQMCIAVTGDADLAQRVSQRYSVVIEGNLQQQQYRFLSLLPLLYLDGSLNMEHLADIVSCSVEPVAGAYSDRNDYKILNTSFCQTCPRLLECMSIPRIEDIVVVEIQTAKSENIPRYLPESTWFSQLVGREITLLSVAYLGLNLFLASGQKLRIIPENPNGKKLHAYPLSSSDDATAAQIKVLDLETEDRDKVTKAEPYFHYSYVIVDNGTVFLCDKGSSYSYVQILHCILVDLLMMFKKDMTEETARATASQNLQGIKKQHASAWGKYRAGVWANLSGITFPNLVVNRESALTTTTTDNRRHNNNTGRRSERFQFEYVDAALDSIISSLGEGGYSIPKIRIPNENDAAAAGGGRSGGGVFAAGNEISGGIAELFVHKFLKAKYPETYDVTKNWVSGNRGKWLQSHEKCDDTLGYDFVIEDTRQLFLSDTKHTSGRTKTCFIEVKGCASSFNNSFFISANEVEVLKRTAAEKLAHYILLIVENCESLENTRFAGVLDCSLNGDRLDLTPTEFSAKITRGGLGSVGNRNERRSDERRNDGFGNNNDSNRRDDNRRGGFGHRDGDDNRRGGFGFNRNNDYDRRNHRNENAQQPRPPTAPASSSTNTPPAAAGSNNNNNNNNNRNSAPPPNAWRKK